MLALASERFELIGVINLHIYCIYNECLMSVVASQRSTQILYNILTNYLRFGFTWVANFLLIPFVIHCVGVEDYGLWTLIYSTIGFLGLLDLGFTVSAIKYVAESNGSGDLERRNRIISTLLATYVILSIIAVACVYLLSLFFNFVFSIPVHQQETALLVLWIIALRSVVLNLPFGLFRGVLLAEQRLYILNMIQIGSQVLYVTSVWIFLSQGMGIVTLAYLQLATMLFEGVICVIIVYFRVDGLCISIRLIDRTIFREILSFSLVQLIMNIASIIAMQMDPVLIKFFLPLSAVAIYGVGLKLSDMFRSFIIQMINVFTPYIAELKGAGRDRRICFLFLWSTKFACALAILLAVPIWNYASDIVALWIGPEFASAGLIVAMLITAKVCSIPWTTASNMLAMIGFHKYAARLALICVVANIVISLILIHPMQLAGVAMGTLLATLIFGTFAVVRKACKVIGITHRDYLSRTLFPVILPGAIQFIMTYAIKMYVPPANLISIALQAIPGIFLFLILFWVVAITSEERAILSQKFSSLPFRRYALKVE